MKSKCYLIVGLCLVCASLFAQLDIDHPIQLTGTGSNAKVSGIQDVTNSQDATSVGSLQSGSFIYGNATGSSNSFSLVISPPIASYQPGMVFNFISNQTVTGPATLNINNLGAVSITKNVNELLAGCEIQNGQAVTVIYDGTNFQMTSAISSLSAPPTIANAGPDQLNVPGHETVTLAANAPTSGTGIWTIISGSGGTITNPSSPTSTFTGQPSTTFLLQWAISNSCGMSLDTVEISFSASCYVPGSQTFTYTGGLQQFTVGCDVTSVTVEAWGAQGGTTTGQNGNGDYTGGLGADIKGTFTVTPGQNIAILVGEQGGYGGCACSAGGGGGSWAVSNGALLLVAGGGGGGFDCTYYGGSNGGNGQASTTGGAGIPSGSAQPGDQGATNGDGANGYYGGGGGGWLGAGSSSYGVGGGAYPGAPVAGGGGYGGGGGGYSGCCGDSGGGGGYSGGGSGSEDGCAGGGGGSYNSGTNQTNTGGVQSGNGKVTLTW